FRAPAVSVTLEPGSEEKLQRQLQDARVVCAAGMQEALVETTLVASGIVGAAVATDPVANAVPLRVIEHVEGFGAELETGALVYREVLEQPRVEVPAAGNIQEVTAGIAKG